MRRALATAVVCLVPLFASAQEEPPALQTSLTPDVIRVGDPVTLVVTVTHAQDAEVAWPDPVAVDPFELLETRTAAPVPEANQVRSRLELTVTAFELGELSLPGLEVRVVEADGDVVTLTTAAATVTVESVGRDEGGDIRDIKGPLAIPFQVLTLLPWLVALAVLAALAYGLYRRVRRRARPDAAEPVAPPRPAHLVARESLDALESSGLLELGEIKTYHIRVSDIMRVYVEGRFGIEAMEMTTGEVLAGLRRAGLGTAVVADFRQLLDRCDLVKFAKFRPPVPDCRDLVPRGRRLVEATTPAELTSLDATAEASVA